MPISFIIPSALWDWNASHVHATGIGASEKTIVFLAEELARRGHDTEAFGPVNEEEVYASVGWWKREKARWITPSANVVVSRAPGFYKGAVAPALLRPLERKPVLWLQDAYYPDLNASTIDDYRAVVVLTKWHQQALAEFSKVDPARFTVIENFIVPEHFGRDAGGAKKPGLSFPARDPFKFVYASSPDRGLLPLMRLWPKIVERYPKATLHIFYGWEGAAKLAVGNPAWATRYRAIRGEFDKLRKAPGIVERGRVNHVTLAQEMLSAGIWCYPCVDFSESGCAAAAEARSAGCALITTTVAALTETARCPTTQFVDLVNGDTEAFNAGLLAAIDNAVVMEDDARAAQAQAAVKHFALDRIADSWETVLR
jgi:glycosyltransferase involved in cell wall biosynthesis